MTDQGTATADDLVDWIAGRKGTSFVEVAGWLEDHGIPPRGTMTLSKGSESLVLWANLSDQASALIVDALDSGRLELRPLSAVEAFIVYGADGGMLNLPLATELDHPPTDADGLHWAACTIEGRSDED